MLRRMIIELGTYRFNFPGWIVILASFIIAFGVTYIVIPSIIKVSREKHLFDQPNSRKSHTSAVPTLGGAAVFLGLVLPTTLFGDLSFEHELKYIITGLLILFFTGIKDDILVISARKKLIAEILAISIIVILGNIRVTSFHGFLGIEEIPYIGSILFTIFMFVVIINGFNLIDGIDGLASGVGILTISCLGIWFILIGDSSYAAFSFSTVGALAAFFRYNVFSKMNKIFLGDTGSLIIGLIISIFTICFLESNLTSSIGAMHLSAPAIAIGLLIVPLIDTLRVFILRLIVGKSPFTADRFHIHHRLLRLDFSHLHSTLLLLGFNLFIIVLTVLLRHLGNIKMLLIVLPTAVFITSIPGFFIRYKDRKILHQLQILGNKTWILPITFTNTIISRRERIGRANALEGSTFPKGQPARRVIEPVLHETFLKYKDDTDFTEPAELEEYPD